MTQNYTAPPPPGRPIADKLVYEIFFDKKCAKKEPDHTRFYKWCASAGSSTIKTTCSSMSGGTADCFLEAKFNNLGGSYDDEPAPLMANPTSHHRTLRHLLATNSTTNSTAPNNTTGLTTTTTTRAPLIDDGDDDRPGSGRYQLDFTVKCDLGGQGKDQIWQEKVALNGSMFKDLTETCYQEIHGKPYKMPWWLILIIVLFVIAAVSVALTLFWRYYLSKKVYGKNRDGNSSGMSRWTSAPFSSASAASGMSNKGSSRASRSRARGSSSVMPSGSSRPSGFSSSSRPSSSRYAGSSSKPSTSGATGYSSGSSAQPSKRSSSSLRS